MATTVLGTKKMFFQEGRVFQVATHHVRQHLLLPSTSDSYCVGMFTGMVFFSLYLANKMSVFRRNGRGHSLRLIIVLVPIIAAMIVAITRLRDYWHHWEGILLVCASVQIFVLSFYISFYIFPLSPPLDITVGALMGENMFTLIAYLVTMLVLKIIFNSSNYNLCMLSIKVTALLECFVNRCKLY